MLVKIRHERDKEPVNFCTIFKPEEIENVIKTLHRAGGIFVAKTGKQSGDLVYRWVYGEKSVYAEIVVHDEPQA